RLCLFFAVVSLALFLAWLMLALPNLEEALLAIAYNEGKHPPETAFMLFSMGGAFGILALALFGGATLAKTLRPIAIIGSDALKAFIFHIFVIFVLFRY